MKRNLLNLLLIVTASSYALPAGAQATGAQGHAWPLCPTVLDVPPRPIVDEVLEPGDVHINADTADMVEGGTSHFEGNAEVTRDRQQTRADVIDYHEPEDNADLKGNVNYWDDDVYLHSDTAHIEFNASTGTFENADYRLLDNRGRGKAKELFVHAGTLTRGQSIDFTTCDPEVEGWDLASNFWKISAKELTLDYVQDRGSAKHVVLRIKDVPVFYTPYISFPLSDKRKSGLLLPGLGNSRRNGFELLAPYYWNIAPAMDATLTPRLITNSGMMLMGEYRYLKRDGKGTINVEYLPSDTLFDDEDRSAVDIELSQSIARAGNFSVSYHRVSDKYYFEDFGSNLITTSIPVLLQQATYSNSWNVHGHSLSAYSYVQAYQTIDRSIPIAARPYKRLPTIQLNLSSPYANRSINYGVRGQTDYFTRGDDPLLNSVNGFRFDLYPSMTYPIRTQAGFLIPKLGVRYTQYELNENNFFKNSPSRTLPFFSLDSGLFLEREFTALGDGYLQTLEPRAYYLYMPKTDQTDLPIFDTALYDTSSVSSLFYEDRFSGPDRMGANQVSLVTTSRLYKGSTGGELGYVSLGETFRLRDREVGLPGFMVQNNTLSSFVAEFGTNYIHHWWLRGDIAWEPNLSATQKMSFQAQYLPGDGKVLNLAYRVRRDPTGIIQRNPLDIDQTDISFRLPLGSSWSVIGRWNYAVPEGKSLDMFGGIEYESCCWGVRAVARRFLANLDGDFQTGFFLQFELKGLAGIGDKTVDFLTHSIPGYAREF